MAPLADYRLPVRRLTRHRSPHGHQQSRRARETGVVSIDVIRGLVMVLMAIDHVRVFSGVPAGGPTPGIFFTRWITHFCAPAFVFLAGTSAFLTAAAASRSCSRFLLVRGLWLVLLELTVIRVAWTFNFDFAHYLLAGVIWMIGWCMVLLAGAGLAAAAAIATFGLAVIALHNARACRLVARCLPACAPGSPVLRRRSEVRPIGPLMPCCIRSFRGSA